jgi:hypothetical protein
LEEVSSEGKSILIREINPPDDIIQPFLFMHWGKAIPMENIHALSHQYVDWENCPGRPRATKLRDERADPDSDSYHLGWWQAQGLPQPQETVDSRGGDKPLIREKTVAFMKELQKVGKIIADILWVLVPRYMERQKV